MLAAALVPLVVGLGASLLLTPLVRLMARRYGLVVRPRADRWHTVPTALYGGVAIAIASCLAIAVAVIVITPGSGRSAAGAILAVGIAMFALGVFDDARGMSPIAKLIVQFAGGAFLVWSGLTINLTPWMSINVPITMFWFVGVSNALNLLDNMDGAAAGVSAVAAAGFSILFFRAGDILSGMVALSVAGSAAGFLTFNFKPASIFMGDSGSLFLGGVLASLGIAYSQSIGSSGPVVLLVPVLILLVPVVDTTLVTFTRVLNGRRISVGGRDHTTHRLVAMGLSERQTALALHACTATSAAIAAWISSADVATALWVGTLFLTAALIFAGYLGTLHEYHDGGAGNGRTVLLRRMLIKRRGFVLVLDTVLFCVAYYGAFLIYYDYDLPARVASIAGTTVGMVLVIKLIAFNYFKVYRAPWNVATLADVHAIIKAATLGTLLLIAVSFIIARGGQIPRTVFILDLMFTCAFALAARSSFQSLERLRRRIRGLSGRSAIIYAPPVEAELVMAAMSMRPELDLHPIGIVTDDDALAGEYVRGIPVVTWGERLDTLLERAKAKVIVRGNGGLSPMAREHLARLELPVVQFTAEFIPTVMTDRPLEHAQNVGAQ